MALRTHDRFRMLEAEMYARFPDMDPMVLLYLLNLPPHPGEFSDRYVAPMLEMLWKGSVLTSLVERSDANM